MKKIFVSALFVLASCSLAYADTSCDVVGIKSTKQFLKKTQRTCFATPAAAKKKGFTQFAPTAIGFKATMDGTQEVPTVVTSAAGSCTAVFKSSDSTLTLICVHTATSPIAAHVHNGPVGQDGAVICDLGSGVSPIVATCTLSAANVSALLTGLLYVNVHTEANSGGEIRGQLL